MRVYYLLRRIGVTARLIIDSAFGVITGRQISQYLSFNPFIPEPPTESNLPDAPQAAKFY